MATTTISIDEKTREKLAEFKRPGESYDELLQRLYESAAERQLQDILMNTKDSLTLDEAEEFIKANG